MLFLANLASKMKRSTKLGSRIVEVHNGSSLFTGDAGQGESNIRRWIIENDWLEAIVALPLNMFYNTGIATYIWVLTNKKAKHRKGKVQLIDATAWYKPLRKNLGKKNCELSVEDIDRITNTFLEFRETDQSKIFDNEAFGYWKVVIERPLRLRVDLSEAKRKHFRVACVDAKEEPIAKLVDNLAKSIGEGPHINFNKLKQELQALAEDKDVKLTAKRLKLLQSALAEHDERAEPVIKKVHKTGDADSLHGVYEIKLDGKSSVIEYEPDSDLRDSEQVPLQEVGGIEAFIRREVLPHAGDAWIDEDKAQIGYELSFNRYFYKPQPPRSLEQIKKDIFSLERQTEGLLKDIVGSSI
jgi:type I restriction enzyme M protein